MVKKAEKNKEEKAAPAPASGVTADIKICTSCGANISSNEPFVRFLCPSCGKVRITRCNKCKLTSNDYKCSCGFEGP